MRGIIKTSVCLLLMTTAMMLTSLKVEAISLWVGESYTWDFSGSVMGSTYNMSVSTNGGYLSVTGSGFYRTIKPTQYFSGTATVTAEWDYTLYYGDTKRHQRVSVTISCYENKASISPTSVMLSPGETYQLGYRHAYDNQYVGAANAYFSGGNSSFSVTSSGLITAKTPGSGYVNLYSKVSDASNAPACHVTVREVAPTGASTGNVSVYADQSVTLNANVSPSNATVKSREWYVKSGAENVSISGSRLTGLKPGTAVVYCMINGSIRSNDATVTVIEPKLTAASTFPAGGATGVSPFVNPYVTYSHAIVAGERLSGIGLTVGGRKVDGAVDISGKELRFLPGEPLSPLTAYTLTVPRDAVKNKWGSAAQEDVSLSFTTADYEKTVVKVSPSDGAFLTSNDVISISATPEDAQIYYTVDGSDPKTSGKLYSEPIKMENAEMTVKVFARRKDYRDSDVVAAKYYKSQSEIDGYYPNDNSSLFNYAYACPYLRFSGPMEKSNNFRRITMTSSNGETVSGEAYLTYYLIIFVPDSPLRNSTTYTVDIPNNAVKAQNGELFKGFKWSFTTPTLPVAIEMQGDETVYLLNEDGTVKTRGMDYLTTTPADGSFTFEDVDVMKDVKSDVTCLSSGYTHSLFAGDNELAGDGLAFCNETATAKSVYSLGAIKQAKAGFQTSAIIAADNSLWLCGRNDFYQLGDGTGTTSKAYIKVAENVIDVALGNGYTLYVDGDNTLWGVGRNHMGQLGDGTMENRKTPVKIMENVENVFVSKSGFFSACITTDNKLMTWGDNTRRQLGRGNEKVYQTPGMAMNNVVSVSLGESHTLAVNNNYELYAWGDNSFGQINSQLSLVEKPLKMADNVKSATAGQNTSLLLYINGKVTGWGRKTHSNFGVGEGNAKDFIVVNGQAYSRLNSVTVEPSKFEVEPYNTFAIEAMPRPLAADFERIEWSSDNPAIASVDEKGVITTGNIGEAIITARIIDRYGNIKESSSKVVCTNTPDNSDIRLGVAAVEGYSPDWFAFADGRTIVVSGANIGETYRLYNMHGIEIAACVATGDNPVFEVAQEGVYIVRSTNQSVKVICR